MAAIKMKLKMRIKIGPESLIVYKFLIKMAAYSVSLLSTTT
jgi:hypothetical protein